MQHATFYYIWEYIYLQRMHLCAVGENTKTMTNHDLIFLSQNVQAYAIPMCFQIDKIFLCREFP